MYLIGSFLSSSLNELLRIKDEVIDTRFVMVQFRLLDSADAFFRAKNSCDCLSMTPNLAVKRTSRYFSPFSELDDDIRVWKEIEKIWGMLAEGVISECVAQ